MFTTKADVFAAFIRGEIDKDSFLKDKAWKDFVDFCKESEAAGLSNWAESHVEGEPDNVDHVEPEYIANALRSIRNFFHNEKIDFAVDPDLAKLIADRDFIDALQRDKNHIDYMKQVIGDALSNCPSLVHFIRVGWFDEPFDSKGIDVLLDLFDKSSDLATNMILEEKTGTFFRSTFHKETDCTGLFSPLENNSDSWNEWVHIFPYTIQFFLGNTFNLDEHLYSTNCRGSHNFGKIKERLGI
jgi:hypothetical protein